MSSPVRNRRTAIAAMTALVTAGAAFAVPAFAAEPPVTGSLTMYDAGSWYAGGQFLVHNPGTQAQDWSLGFTVPDGVFQNSSEWNIDATVVGDRVTLTPKSGTLAAGASAYIGFGVSGDGSTTLSVSECDLGGRAVAGCGAASGDTEPPTVPGSLTADANDESSVHVMWQHSTDNVGVAGYKVFQDGVEVKQLGGTMRMTDIRGLAPATEYSFAVQAIDAAGNASARTEAVSVTTPGAPVEDSEAPSAITDFAASASGPHTVTTSWTPASDNVGVSHYLIRDGVSDKTTTVSGSASSATVVGLTADSGYAFSITAYDAAGNATASNVVDVSTPPETPVDPGTGVPADFTAAADSYLDGSERIHRLALGWTPAPETTRYEVHIDGAFAQTILVGLDGNDTQRRFVPVEPGTHTVKIRAMSPDGTWSAFTPELTVAQ